MASETAPATEDDKTSVAAITKIMHGTKLEGGKSLWSTTVDTMSMADGKTQKNDAICTTVEEAIASLADMVNAIQATHKKWLFPVTPLKEFNKTADDLMRAFCMWAKNDEEETYNVSKAFRRLESYVTWMDQNNIDLQASLTTESVKESDKVWNMKLTYDKEGRMVWWIDMGSLNIEKIKEKGSHVQALRYFVWISHVIMFDTRAQEKGMVVVEAIGAKLSMWTMMTLVPGELSAKLDRLTIGVLPVKMKKIFIIQAPGWIRLLMTLMKPFLSKKMRQRMVSVSKRDGVAQATLDEEIGREGTPPMFGGFEGSAEKEIVAELLRAKE
jgi:hypothetical protein